MKSVFARLFGSGAQLILHLILEEGVLWKEEGRGLSPRGLVGTQARPKPHSVGKQKLDSARPSFRTY